MTYIPVKDIVYLYISADGYGNARHINDTHYTIHPADMPIVLNQLISIRADFYINVNHIVEINDCCTVKMRSKYTVTETDYSHYDPSTNNYRLVDKQYNDSFGYRGSMQELLDKINNFYLDSAIDKSIRINNLEDT